MEDRERGKCSYDNSDRVTIVCVSILARAVEHLAKCNGTGYLFILKASVEQLNFFQSILFNEFDGILRAYLCLSHCYYYLH